MSMMETVGKRIAELEDPAEIYSDGLTKQTFKDETDINRLLAGAQKGQSLAHLVRHGAQYGDFSDVDDLLSAYARWNRGLEIFDDLPSEVKKDFGNDAGAFFAYVNDPANSARLAELLPALAKPGRHPTVLNQPDRLDTKEAETPPAASEAPQEPQKE